MKPNKLIKETTPAQLAKARGKLQAHSTRDKPKFIKQLDHILETFKNLGYDLTLNKIDEEK